MNYLIKIDELKEIMFKVTTMEIAYDKACELISEICEKRALTIHSVVRPNLTDKHPIEGVNEFMQTDTELKVVQLCGKSNCNRQKLGSNMYCSYHYDITFG